MATVKKYLKGVQGLLGQKSLKTYFGTLSCLERQSRLILFFIGITLLYAGSSNLAYAGSGTYGNACNGILQLVEGTFGALVTAIAGIGAIVASAVGGFKMAWSLIVVSVGAFVLRAYISLFNGTCA